MRNISASLTKRQILNKSKKETRRLGWWFLKPGDHLMFVEKGMGLKKGEKIKRLHEVIVESTRPERLDKITEIDIVNEGFPGKSPKWFIDFFCRTQKKCTPATVVNVIRFRYA